MAAKKVALFVDVDCLHQHLRNLHNRSLDPKLLLETAQVHGELVQTVAIADWSDLPEETKAGFAEQGVEVVEVSRMVRSRETTGRRREVLRGTVDLEILARIVELLFTDGAPEVDEFVLATSDDAAARIAEVVRARFNKDVVGIGIEGVTCDALKGALSGYESLPMPAIEPQDPESLSRLVPLLEDLERRKRYLNFKYIRETVVRRLDLPERSFDAAERILSDAIACGVLLKQKIDDKYNPGQLFTAYSINRESPYFHEWGSGEPAPEHDEIEEERKSAGARDDGASTAPALPSMGGRSREPKGRSGEGRAAEARDEKPRDEKSRDEKPRDEKSRDEKPRDEKSREEKPRDEKPRDEKRERGRDRDSEREPDRGRDGERPSRRRRRRGGGDGEPVGAGSGSGAGNKRRRRRRGRGAAGPNEDKIKLSAGGGKQRRGGPRNHQQDRVGRMYEAPSRFLSEEKERPQLSDDEIDEDRILRARGDL